MPQAAEFLRSWHILKENAPKGFEKYFQGGKKAAPKVSKKDAPKQPPISKPRGM